LGVPSVSNRDSQTAGAAGRICLTAGGDELYMSSRLYNWTGASSGCGRVGQAKRGAAVLPDSAGLEGTNPFRRTEPGELMPSEQEIAARLGVSQGPVVPPVSEALGAPPPDNV